LQRNEAHIGRPGVDKTGVYCAGECAPETGRDLCQARVDPVTLLVTDCECAAVDLEVPEDGGMTVCMPSKYDPRTDFVHACACQETCHVAQNITQAGRRDLGYDSRGLYCAGACPGGLPCQPTFNFTTAPASTVSINRAAITFMLTSCTCQQDTVCPANQTLVLENQLPGSPENSGVCELVAALPHSHPAFAAACRTHGGGDAALSVELTRCVPHFCPSNDDVRIPCAWNITHEICCETAVQPTSVEEAPPTLGDATLATDLDMVVTKTPVGLHFWLVAETINLTGCEGGDNPRRRRAVGEPCRDEVCLRVIDSCKANVACSKFFTL